MGQHRILQASLQAHDPQKPLPLSLQLLFPAPIGLTSALLERTMAKLHPPLAKARVEVISGAVGAKPDQFGQIARIHWGQHTVHVVSFDGKLPYEATQESVNMAHYADEVKAQAHAHTAHAVLLYRGEEKDPLEQYVALGMIAVAVGSLGASVVLNTSAYTSCPAEALLPNPGEKLDEVLRGLPLPMLFAGFARFEVEGTRGVWMRTCGAPLMNLPDLAVRARSADEGMEVFYRFHKVLHTLYTTQAKFSPGCTIEDGALNWKLRAPRPHERFLDSPKMFVLEPCPP
jgi:hypothetical protein